MQLWEPDLEFEQGKGDGGWKAELGAGRYLAFLQWPVDSLRVTEDRQEEEKE